MDVLAHNCIWFQCFDMIIDLMQNAIDCDKIIQCGQSEIVVVKWKFSEWNHADPLVNWGIHQNSTGANIGSGPYVSYQHEYWSTHSRPVVSWVMTCQTRFGTWTFSESKPCSRVFDIELHDTTDGNAATKTPFVSYLNFKCNLSHHKNLLPRQAINTSAAKHFNFS